MEKVIDGVGKLSVIGIEDTIPVTHGLDEHDDGGWRGAIKRHIRYVRVLLNSDGIAGEAA